MFFIFCTLYFGCDCTHIMSHIYYSISIKAGSLVIGLIS